MKPNLIAVLGILFIGLVVLTTVIPRISTAISSNPTPTHNLVLGTQSPEDAERGFPSPVPTIPPPTDLDPDRPFDEKWLLVFRAPEGEGFVTFLAPHEKIEEQVEKIGVDYLEGIFPSSHLLPPEPDRELRAVQTAVATLTPAPAAP